MTIYGYQELARQRQADLIHEADNERLATDLRRGRGRDMRPLRFLRSARFIWRRRPALSGT
jgi:hypothetical protein